MCKVSQGLVKRVYETNFQLESGDTCAIIGLSGCGKTTLIYTLAGIVKPTSGKVNVNWELHIL